MMEAEARISENILGNSTRMSALIEALELSDDQKLDIIILAKKKYDEALDKHSTGL